ncbi:3-oxoacyl-ACP synthase III family protein [Micromonospora sp. NBS 11-29]|uniref:3-oxoacyl-ACP synthase III family protein n=1 Tax=Micromonospora sp. NBS 11-29 TaxID=1960879 RepID=UPI000B788C33|nr:ketoacyl-ACP synthase III [Micromonospora sp. NBS 11-29]
MSVVITGTGSHLPPRVVTNDAIERASHDFVPGDRYPTLHEWVMDRAGVMSRHRMDPGGNTSDMAVRAARAALDDARLDATDVDLVVLATFTSDDRLPSTVSVVQRALGGSAKCLQLESACSGFVDALLVATSAMATGGFRTALVINVEAMSSIVDPERFMLQTVFGDGAAAVVLRDVPAAGFAIEALRTHTDATHCDWTRAPGRAGGYLWIDHRAIYRFAVEKMVEATLEVLAVNDLTVDDVTWLIPHQTGANIIAEVGTQLKIAPEQIITCLDHTGNISGASVPVALDEARRRGRFRDGDRVVMPVVGGGMAWGAVSAVWRGPTAHRAAA